MLNMLEMVKKFVHINSYVSADGGSSTNEFNLRIIKARVISTNLNRSLHLLIWMYKVGFTMHR